MLCVYLHPSKPSFVPISAPTLRTSATQRLSSLSVIHRRRLGRNFAKLKLFLQNGFLGACNNIIRPQSHVVVHCRNCPLVTRATKMNWEPRGHFFSGSTLKCTYFVVTWFMVKICDRQRDNSLNLFAVT